MSGHPMPRPRVKGRSCSVWHAGLEPGFQRAQQKGFPAAALGGALPLAQLALLLLGKLLLCTGAHATNTHLTSPLLCHSQDSPVFHSEQQ